MIYLESTWTSKPLSVLGQRVTGVTYKKSQSSEEHVEGYIPLLKANNIENNRILYDDFVYVPPDLVKKEKMIQKNDILIAASSGSLSVVGKAAQIKKDWDGSFGAFCKVLRPNTDIVDPGYLSYFFYTGYYRSVISHLAKGANINNINNSHFDELFVPLPPLETQKKIAAVLDKADGLRQKRRQTIEKLDELTQSVFLDMFGDPISNPQNYSTKPLEKVVNVTGGGTPSKKKTEYFNGAIPWITPKDMKKTFVDDSEITVTKLGVENSSAKLIEPYSVLAVVRSGILKRTWPLAINTCEVTVNQDMKAFKCSEEVKLYYLLYFLKLYSRKILGTVRGTTADNISSDDLYNIPVMLAPIEDQKDYSERIKTIVQTKQSLVISRNNLDNLFNSLLQKAFKGELNFRDNDEPLSAAEKNEEYVA